MFAYFVVWGAGRRPAARESRAAPDSRVGFIQKFIKITNKKYVVNGNMLWFSDLGTSMRAEMSIQVSTASALMRGAIITGD